MNTTSTKPGDSQERDSAPTPHAPIDRIAWIAVTAYGIAERRGFEPGHELEDWLKAETQVQFEIVGEGRTF